MSLTLIMNTEPLSPEPLKAESSVPQRLDHAEIERLRQQPGASLLLFITDRCPVGCAHCSVDSRADSPMIQDFQRYGALIDGMADHATAQVIGISGGEPFVERRGLLLASRAFHDAGKQTVIYTSGIWAQNQIPRWIDEVLGHCATVYLSTDAFHQQQVGVEVFQRAAQAVIAHGAWLIVQTLDTRQATVWLQQALGPDFERYAEVVSITPLANGRGREHFVRAPLWQAKDVGACHLATTPVVRYDGVVTACCQEEVIMGQGPSYLRRTAHNAEQLQRALHSFQRDSLLQAMVRVGVGHLTAHPRFQTVRHERCHDHCEACWKMLSTLPEGYEPDPLMQAIAKLND